MGFTGGVAASYFLDREDLSPGECVVRHGDSERGPGWIWFHTPSRIVEARSLEEVLGAVAELEAETAKGKYAVGFLTCEASAAFDASLPPARSRELPLAWFGIYDQPPTFARELLPVDDAEDPVAISPEWDFPQYRERFDAVKRALGDGDAYQINLTLRAEAAFGGSLFRLFRRACGVEPPPYAAFLQGQNWQIASLSPELFFQRRGQTVTMRPMKGTRRAGAADDMTADPKSLAENLMIVDMVRNDLGRLAVPGSVTARSLFHVESHRTVRQMTSTIEAETGASLTDLLKAVFPPASVTGAPKVAACRLIARLEDSPREVYCGAIGIVQPGGNARFSVAIRTAWRTERGPTRYGVGGGLVWDSDPKEEFEECLLKAQVLVQPAPQWELVECFHRDALCDDALLKMHWERLSRSAEALRIPYSRDRFDGDLAPLRASPSELPPKIRIAIRKDGTSSVTAAESAVGKDRLTAAAARCAIQSGDQNLKHKTNSRQVFQEALDRFPAYDEVLLFNERGQAAEFCRGNAVFAFGDRWITPSPECGCLPGIGAKRLVESGKAEYGVVPLEEARKADEVFFVNSIRGLVPVDVDWAAVRPGSCCDPDTTAR